MQPRLEALEDRCLLSGDAILQWNAVALDAVANDYAVGGITDQVGPTRTSRALAIVHTAMYDAFNAVDGSYTPYLFTGHAQAGTSAEGAVAQAGHDTLVALYPHQKQRFDVALAASLVGINAGSANKGIKLGQEVALQILAARQNDGSDIDNPYTPGTAPGQHQPDPLHPDQGFLGPDWGGVTPFAVTSSTQFLAPPPPALSSKEYADAFNEVKSLGGDGIVTPTDRTPEQTIIGFFWSYDASPNLGTPPRLYNQVARVIAQQEGNSEAQNARLFALINLAMADTGITTWETKYDYNFWRPILGICGADNDNNPKTKADPNWTYLGASADNGNGTNFTPPFPAYTSGHAGFGAAAFRTLADFYGTDAIHFSFTSDEFNGITKDQYGVTRPVVTRSYSSFSQATEENGQSRIYLGIHWRFDKVQGIQLGQEIADYVFQHVLLPNPHPAGAMFVASTSSGWSLNVSALAEFGRGASNLIAQGTGYSSADDVQPSRSLAGGSMQSASSEESGNTPVGVAASLTPEAADEVFGSLDTLQDAWPPLARSRL